MDVIKTRKSIDSIDFFKGIAILLVVLVHSAQRFSIPFWTSVIPSIGQLGCQMFFVLSSFSLCLGYSEKKIRYLDFMKRRISKMVIGYWSMIIFYLSLNILFAIRDDESIVTFFANPGLYMNILFLHGFSSDKAVVNGIVRGGWFVGTITVLYLLFPFLLKTFNVKNKIWSKVKIVVFPTTTYILSSLFFILLSCFTMDYTFKNNSVSYFSFINQLPCFALGFSLYEIYKNNIFSKYKYSLIKFIICSTLSLFLFFSKIENSFIFISFIVALAFFYIYVYSQNSVSISDKINSEIAIFRMIKNFGKNSFSIYLTHPIIVHILIKPILEILIKIYDNQIFWYIIFCPIMFILSYYLAVVFNWYEGIIKNIIILFNKN